jgi:hypothetical protein
MKSTREAAKNLNISAAALRAHTAAGHVKAPTRRVGLSYLWSEREIEAARQELLNMEGRRTRAVPRRAAADKRNLNTTQRANTRLKNPTTSRFVHAKTNRKRAWRILNGLRDSLWSLFDKVVKAFFDALFDHLRKV